MTKQEMSTILMAIFAAAYMPKWMSIVAFFTVTVVLYFTD